MKKIKEAVVKKIFVFLALVAAMGLAACSSTETGTATNPASVASPTEPMSTTPLNDLPTQRQAQASDYLNQAQLVEPAQLKGLTQAIRDETAAMAILNIMSPSCPHCIKMLPEHQRLVEDDKLTTSKGDAVLVFGVSPGSGRIRIGNSNQIAVRGVPMHALYFLTADGSETLVPFNAKRTKEGILEAAENTYSKYTKK